MSTVTVALNVPKEVLLDMKTDEKSFANYAKRFLALDLYKNRGISLGYCTEFAGMTEEDFIIFLGKNEVSIFNFDDETDFERELANA